jgi:ABC-type polysaccharide transport system permease subunit
MWPHNGSDAVFCQGTSKPENTIKMPVASCLTEQPNRSKIVIGKAQGFKLFKRVAQTFSTLPHFLSWIIIGGVMVQVPAPAVA